MEEHIFSANYKSERNILGVQDILLDHLFHYTVVKDGMNVEGKIYLSFLLKHETSSEPTSLEVPINLFVAMNEIDCMKEICLELDHFDFKIDGREVWFYVYTRLKGNHEDFVSFEPTQNKEINSQMVSLLMREEKEDSQSINDIDKDYLSKIEQIVSSSEVELISTPFEQIKPLEEEDIIELSTLEDTSEKERNFILNNIKKTMEKIKDNILNVPSLKKEDSQENIVILDSPIEQVPVLKKEDISPKSEEIFKEKYTSDSFYYRLKKEDNIDIIVNKFKCDKQKILSLNKGKEFLEGTLIRIPK